MSQITLYLDAETDALLNAAASIRGVSKSRWVADIIRLHAKDAWPQACHDLAGAFPDFPLRDADFDHMPPDTVRHGF